MPRDQAPSQAPIDGAGLGRKRTSRMVTASLQAQI